ncbi:MAG: ADP-ribosylglycohydrolase family protein [Bacteroidetes bacterium]|nr:MAG: ADP-ribosylglycohydrolase family protein [Bacteroidota bacterium]
MLGAIAGDIIGSVYEKQPVKTTDFPLFLPESRFTDDTVLTVAIADSLLHDRPFAENVRKYARAYPLAGYGGSFMRWMSGLNEGPYHSWGNGAAMRVSPVGFAFEELETVKQVARETAIITHDHPEGVKGAQAVAAAVYLARSGYGKALIKDHIERHYAYDLSRTLADIRPMYCFEVSCQGSVPQSIRAFLESTSWESAVRNAISLGGDADTMACIVGAIAEAFYGGVPVEIEAEVIRRLPADFQQTIDLFYEAFPWEEG